MEHPGYLGRLVARARIAPAPSVPSPTARGADVQDPFATGPAVGHNPEALPTAATPGSPVVPSAASPPPATLRPIAPTSGPFAAPVDPDSIRPASPVTRRPSPAADPARPPRVFPGANLGEAPAADPATPAGSRTSKQNRDDDAVRRLQPPGRPAFSVSARSTEAPPPAGVPLGTVAVPGNPPASATGEPEVTASDRLERGQADERALLRAADQFMARLMRRAEAPPPNPPERESNRRPAPVTTAREPGPTGAPALRPRTQTPPPAPPAPEPSVVIGRLTVEVVPPAPPMRPPPMAARTVVQLARPRTHPQAGPGGSARFGLGQL